MKKMIEVCKDNTEKLFAIAAMVCSILSYIVLCFSWKVSLVIAVISLTLPHESREGKYYRIQKYGRIFSRMILVIMCTWFCLKLLGTINSLYIYEKKQNIEAVNNSVDMSPHFKTLVEYRYVIPRGFVEFVKEIW